MTRDQSKWAPGLETFIKKYNIKQDKWGRLILYKTVSIRFGSWWKECHNIFTSTNAYKPGTLVECKHYDTDRRKNCGEGLHVATFSFAYHMQYWTWISSLIKVVQVRVWPKDIVCVPHTSTEYGARSSLDGKIRCKKLYVEKVIQ